MKVRYFVGMPEDAFRKHDVVFTYIKSADQHCAESPGLHTCDTLLVYKATNPLRLASELLLVLDLIDLCDRFDRTYKGRGLDPQPNIYDFFEKFVARLLRFRRMAQK